MAFSTLWRHQLTLSMCCCKIWITWLQHMNHMTADMHRYDTLSAGVRPTLPPPRSSAAAARSAWSAPCGQNPWPGTWRRRGRALGGRCPSIRRSSLQSPSDLWCGSAAWDRRTNAAVKITSRLSLGRPEAVFVCQWKEGYKAWWDLFFLYSDWKRK